MHLPIAIIALFERKGMLCDAAPVYDLIEDLLHHHSTTRVIVREAC